MTPAFDPIAPWPLVALAAVAIVVLTLLAYRRKLRGTEGRWRWFALGLRMAALALCIFAALRPSLLLMKKEKLKATVIFATDASSSMGLGGEAGGQTRLQAAENALKEGLEAIQTLGPDVSPRSFVFDANLREPKPGEKIEAKGRQTAIGTAMEEAVKQNSATRVLAYVLLSDGNSNTGPDPRAIAQSLRNQQIPVIAVGFGSDSAASGTRDVAIRDLEAGKVVYAKTELEVFAKLDVRGYGGETLDVELFAEGNATPVARGKIPVPPDATEITPKGLKWTPQIAGETKLTLKVHPKGDDLIKSNNETSTFVTVLKGGIGVLYLTSVSSPWERKFVARALLASEKIQLSEQVLFEPAGRELDAELRAGKYDVFIIGDLPAEYLSTDQRRRLKEAVDQGAGLIMLGGRNSFGPGGWDRTELADVLPVEMHPGDPQNEPEGGLKVIPNPVGLDAYVLRVAPTRAETEKAWKELPPIGGANEFTVKQAARLWAVDQSGKDLMAAIEPGKGRVLAFAGETWPWARYSEQGRLVHLNFWRNAILWLAHKEDEGENQVRLDLDHRRVALGQKVDMTASVIDPKGESVDGVEFKATITRIAEGAKGEPVSLYRQGESSKGSHFATGDPGDYKVEVTATKDGQTIGSTSARFLVFDDDRELRNPAADLALLRAVARESGGTYLPPEKLKDHLKSLGDQVVPDYVTQQEILLWDNWPFLLIFTVLLAAEWWLRKRHGWV
jgi:hypothetical protein